MFERFTDSARQVLVIAQEEARLLDHNYIGTEHLALALARQGQREEGHIALRALEQMGATYDQIHIGIEKALEGTPSTGSATGSPPFTPRAKKVLEYSLREALQLGHNYIGTEHVLLGLVREGEGLAADVLKQLGVELSPLRSTIIELIGQSLPRPTPSDRYTLTLTQQERNDLIQWINDFANLAGGSTVQSLISLPKPLSDLLSRLRRPS